MVLPYKAHPPEFLADVEQQLMPEGDSEAVAKEACSLSDIGIQVVVGKDVTHICMLGAGGLPTQVFVEGLQMVKYLTVTGRV